MLSRENRLTDSKDFDRVFKEGRSFANRNLVLYYKHRSDAANFRLGLSVSKKVGNAVTRNRVRRLMREAFRSLLDEAVTDRSLLDGHDFVLIARVSASSLEFAEMKQNIVHLLQKCGFLPRQKNSSTYLEKGTESGSIH